MIKLPVQAREKVVQVSFIVDEAYSLYTAILARPWLHAMGAVSFTLHLKVKYLIGGQVGELVGSQAMARQCLVAAIKQQSLDKVPIRREEALQQLAKPEDGLGIESQVLLSEELERVMISLDEDKSFQVRAQLPPIEKEELVDFLKGNVDVLAWSAYEAPGIDPDFICHQLNVSTGAIPRRQPPRCSSKEHAEVVKEEVNKLNLVGKIKEAFYSQ